MLERLLERPTVQAERTELGSWADLCLGHMGGDELDRILASASFKSSSDEIYTSLGLAMRELDIVPRAMVERGLQPPWTRFSDDQNVVPLKRSTKIKSVPETAYFTLVWTDALTENMEGIDIVSRALHEANGGKSPKRYEKQLLRVYFEKLGSLRSSAIGRSGYPEFVEKRVNRYLWLAQAFEAGEAIYPKGYPLPFTQNEQRVFEAKLLKAGVPRDGARQLIGSLKKLAKHQSRRASRH